MAKQVKVIINCGNAAFEDYPELEVSRILQSLASKVTRYELSDYVRIPLQDVNGNTVGYMEMKDND